MQVDEVKGIALETPDSDFDAVMNAADILRRHILDFTRSNPYTFNGSLIPRVEDVTPILYMFMRWIIAGKKQDLPSERRSTIVNTIAVTQSLNLSYALKSDHQVSHVPKRFDTGFRNVEHENPQVLALGMATRKYTRSQAMANLLNKLNLFLPNRRMLQIEMSLANSVIARLSQHPSGKWLFEFLVDGQFPYIHINNCDFTIDTSDGKDQLHGALIILFQNRVTQKPTYKIDDVNMDTTSYAANPLPFTDVQMCDDPHYKKNLLLPAVSPAPDHGDSTELQKIHGRFYLRQTIPISKHVTAHYM